MFPPARRIDKFLDRRSGRSFEPGHDQAELAARASRRIRCLSAGAALFFFARARGRVLFGARLVMGWSSVSGRAPCAASHHPRPGRDMTPVRAGGERGLSRSST